MSQPRLNGTETRQVADLLDQLTEVNTALAIMSGHIVAETSDGTVIHLEMGEGDDVFCLVVNE